MGGGGRGGEGGGGGGGAGGRGGGGGWAAAVPASRTAAWGEEGSGAGAGTGLRRPVLARPAARAPSAAALLSIHPGLLHYILLNLNTSNTSLLDLQYSRQYILQFFNTPLNTSFDTSWRDSIHASTSFNTSCHENNTSDTSFNTLRYILPVFNTSDVLEDVLDVLTSNTSCNTSQYILPLFGYIPIHPACIGMYWMY